MHPNRIFGSDSAQKNFWNYPKACKTIRFPNRTCKRKVNEAGFGSFRYTLQYGSWAGRRHHKESTSILPQRLANTGAQIIGTVHDEIILEVPEKIADDVAAILNEIMIRAGKAYLVRVQVEVEITIGETWAEK
jgi:hypothetical protein